MIIYAISDTHFGHAKQIEHGRPSDFEARIIHNLAYSKGDLLIHCGDFCIGNDEIHHDMFMFYTKGFKKRILVRGNHDKKSDKWYLDHGWDMVVRGFYCRYFGKKIYFSHIPTRKVEKYDYNIHGHLHGDQHRVDDIRKSKYDPFWHLDLAPEIRNYAPVNLEDLIKDICLQTKLRDENDFFVVRFARQTKEKIVKGVIKHILGRGN